MAEKKQKEILSHPIFAAFLLASIVALGAFLRFTGIDWDESYHLHPDERFLTMVETSISPVESLSEYFNTSVSSLNPHNIKDANGNSVYPFFVYGTFPIMLVRYMAEWTNQTGYSQIHIVGRYLSGLFDLGTVFLTFLIARQLFREHKWVPYLAAFLYACAVLPIQISHFFIVDNFTTFFTLLAVYAAVKVFYNNERNEGTSESLQSRYWWLRNWQDFLPYGLFGIALGLACASKINAIVVAALLPLAAFLNDPGIFSKSGSLKVKARHFVFSALVFLIFFRIFQPYAFQGPGFFNISPNPRWIQNLRELSFLSSGSSNYPPSLQWARRSVLFPIKNLIIWGLGIPFGLSAIGGLTWMAVEIIKGQSRKFILVWTWSLLYLLWQALRWNPTMRYFLLIYPTLAVIAAWFAYKLVDKSRKFQKSDILPKLFSLLVIVILVVGTFIWALSFTNIYREPVTRIAASEWIYHNIEGAVNLMMGDKNGDFFQALPYPQYFDLQSGELVELDFVVKADGQIDQIFFDSVSSLSGSSSMPNLRFSITDLEGADIFYENTLRSSTLVSEDVFGREYSILIAEPIPVEAGQTLKLLLDSSDVDGALRLAGDISLGIENGFTQIDQPIFEASRKVAIGERYQIPFFPYRDSVLSEINFFRVLATGKNDKQVGISVEILERNSGTILSSGYTEADLSTPDDFRGKQVVVPLENEVLLSENEEYVFSIELTGGPDGIIITGSNIAKETDWDDALPLFMFGQNPFDRVQGIYYSELNFQMYWEDDSEKLARFISILERADYILITSNRQWGSTTQISERYPLTQEFYNSLIGCPYDDIQYCYRIANPGRFKGSLGFVLEKTFQVNPRFLSFEFNSQFAEEAFTVYDHPKVFIFKKSGDYSLPSILDVFETVNLDEVLVLSPEEADARPGELLLSDERFAEQKEAGTWSDLFNYESLQNKYPFISIAIWYLGISLFGWVSYPLVRRCFSGLRFKGFPVSKPIGLLLISFVIWVLGSVNISATRVLIFSSFLLWFLINVLIFFFDKKEIIPEINKDFPQLLRVELIGLGFFILFLFVRLGNPDLWHPYKGGEKPMDFSYFNAVIKSIHFPPYDPWYAQGYINYYYFGFVLAAVPTKLLGIVPSISYNLILPTFFSYTAMAAFCMGGNLAHRPFNKKFESDRVETIPETKFLYIPALFSSFFVVIIGNLGTIMMIIQGFTQIGMSGAEFIPKNILDQLSFLVNGIKLYLSGVNFRYYPGDWYWIPSRAIPGEPITEFPYFTFLYGDPHAHLFAYPFTIISLSWVLSLLKDRFRSMKSTNFLLAIMIGALIVGILKPTNTWDFPTYLALGSCVLFYSLVKWRKIPEAFFPFLKNDFRKVLFAGTLTLIFVLLTNLISYPFSRWFGQGYTNIDIWKGNKTPLGSYFIHWGLFLFIVCSWLIHKIIQFLSKTPVSAVKPYYRIRNWIGIGALIILGVVLFLAIWGVGVVVIIAPAVLLAAVLLFLKGTSITERFVLLLTVSGLFLTFLVEVIVLEGDIGRMNTVFKFYLQAWTMFSISSAYFFYDFYVNRLNSIGKYTRLAWKTIFAILVISVSLFPVLGTVDKITDRISDLTPLTLDGMEFMKNSTYVEDGIPMELGEDYSAIRWMQDNIHGTPVIVEANIPEYRWGNRYTIYTGLPGVVGWNWHQRQQRAINPASWVTNRIDGVNEFYFSENITYAVDFINIYDVEYIVVGQLERIVYPEEGLGKFDNLSGELWDPVYQSGSTTIYKVRDGSLQ